MSAPRFTFQRHDWQWSGVDWQVDAPDGVDGGQVTFVGRQVVLDALVRERQAIDGGDGPHRLSDLRIGHGVTCSACLAWFTYQVALLSDSKPSVTRARAEACTHET